MDNHIIQIIVKEVIKELRTHPIKWQDDNEGPEGEDEYYD